MPVSFLPFRFRTAKNPLHRCREERRRSHHRKSVVVVFFFLEFGGVCVLFFSGVFPPYGNLLFPPPPFWQAKFLLTDTRKGSPPTLDTTSNPQHLHLYDTPQVPLPPSPNSGEIERLSFFFRESNCLRQTIFPSMTAKLVPFQRSRPTG